jgi:hypothetical protein
MAQWIVATSLAMVAGWLDWRSRRIPNWLTISGLIIPSFPGAPAQTKYPIVNPWLLSFIWKWHPAFPENLKQAVRLTEFFGCWSLLVSFLLLRKLPGIGQWPALFLVALSAVSPIFLRLSGVVMTEVPFMALLLTAALLADSAMRQGAAALFAIATGGVAGLSVGLRTIGIAVVAGILLAALWRRAYRQAILFCAAAGFVMAIESWPMLFHHTAAESQTTGNRVGSKFGPITQTTALFGVCLCRESGLF